MPIRVDWTGGASIRAVAYSSAIDALWAPGNSIHIYSENVARRVRNRARQNAPIRTWTLWRGIDVRYSRSANVRSITQNVVSTARHSLWVHEGTNGVMFDSGNVFIPTTGPGHILGRSRSRHRGSTYGPRRVRNGVRGQLANPFLSDALDAVIGADNRFMGSGGPIVPIRPRRR